MRFGEDIVAERSFASLQPDDDRIRLQRLGQSERESSQGRAPSMWRLQHEAARAPA